MTSHGNTLRHEDHNDRKAHRTSTKKFSVNFVVFVIFVPERVAVARGSR
jgi:hypothetical protein